MKGTSSARGGASSVAGRLARAPKPSLPQALLLIGLLVFIGLVGTRTWGLISELSAVREARHELEDKRGALESRHADLERQVQFVQDPENLETELRSRFNYKKPGEKVIVVVPPQEQEPAE